jgi:heme A synthase
MKRTYFAIYAWGVLAYNLVVILWGAYVRASGSGAGCGSHWPLCNGVVIPLAPQVATLIEFTHRLTSGLSLLFILVLLVWAWRAFPKGSPVRMGAVLSMTFILTEALIGAGLVLFSWVANDASVNRAIAISIHFLNTFFLLASISLTAWWASGGERLQLSGQGWTGWGLALGWLGLMLLGVSGALTALGDTLFPVSTLAEGIRQDFSPTASFLIRLRLFHPFIAMTVGTYIGILVAALGLSQPDLRIRRLGVLLIGILVLQMGAGLLNVYLLAPIWLQLIHLFLADSAWISLVLFSAMILTPQKADVRAKSTSRISSSPASSSD